LELANYDTFEGDWDKDDFKGFGKITWTINKA